MPQGKTSVRSPAAVRLAALWVVTLVGLPEPRQAAVNPVDTVPTKFDFSVAAYLPEWRYEGADFESMAHGLTHLILFSLEPTPKGKIASRDRLPRPLIMKKARDATRAHGCRLILCFGGNGRSAGFSSMVRSKKSRNRFVGELMKLLERHQMDGVDYNWEYPGYSFSKGYLPQEEIQADYKGLAALVKETRAAFSLAEHQRRDGGWFPDTVTVAYYPDTRQEQMLSMHGLMDPDHGAHLLHAMAYDANGDREGHSSLKYTNSCLSQAVKYLSGPSLPTEKGRPHRMTLGLPFYGRFLNSGDWKSYEDILVHANLGKSLPAELDTLKDPETGGLLAFNGVDTIRAKVAAAVEVGAGGVMIWEVGQDCRLMEVQRADRPKERHVVTCPREDDSLLLAINRELDALGIRRMHRSFPNSTHAIQSNESQGDDLSTRTSTHTSDEL